MPTRSKSPLLTLVGTAAATVIAATTAGCGGSSSGAAEDALVIYSGRQEALVKPLLEQFTRDTGIEVSVRYGNTAQLAAQLLEEGDRTPADVFFSQDGGALGALTKAQRLEKLPDQVLETVPAAYRADDGTWVGTSGRARVIVYDPRQVPQDQVPDSVFELTDERWRGKVGISPSNASFEAFVTAMRVLNGEDAASRWLADMRANDVQTFDNNVLILDAVREGTLQLGLINHYYWYEQVAEEGRDTMAAQLKFLPGGDPGALVNVAGVGVLRGSDRAEQAWRFAEYLLQADAQRYFAEETKEYPLVPGVDPVEDLPPLPNLQSPRIDLSDLDTLEETLTLIQDAGLT